MIYYFRSGTDLYNAIEVDGDQTRYRYAACYYNFAIPTEFWLTLGLSLLNNRIVDTSDIFDGYIRSVDVYHINYAAYGFSQGSWGFAVIAQMHILMGSSCLIGNAAKQCDICDRQQGYCFPDYTIDQYKKENGNLETCSGCSGFHTDCDPFAKCSQCPVESNSLYSVSCYACQSPYSNYEGCTLCGDSLAYIDPNTKLCRCIPGTYIVDGSCTASVPKVLSAKYDDDGIRLRITFSTAIQGTNSLTTVDKILDIGKTSIKEIDGYERAAWSKDGTEVTIYLSTITTPLKIIWFKNDAIYSYYKPSLGSIELGPHMVFYPSRSHEVYLMTTTVAADCESLSLAAFPINVFFDYQ